MNGAQSNGTQSDGATKEDFSFSFELAPASADQVLKITMEDQQGVENRVPFRLIVSVIQDLVPEVSIRPRNIGTAVTSQASIPWDGVVHDSHGLDQV